MARSIPACTGNPHQHLAGSRPLVVYPRVYGESYGMDNQARMSQGLSPRVRGIHRAQRLLRHAAGSIPACTGNPGRRTTLRAPRGVYPRVYGESTTGRQEARQRPGLSPRVRGIHRHLPLSCSSSGSIPACTGNPTESISGGTNGEVYPRVYGESVKRDYEALSIAGLSPRVRGIHAIPRPGDGKSGSIPACTGNPAYWLARLQCQRVYPRVYGESWRRDTQDRRNVGLSPRVRGIRSRNGRCAGHRRSIPACTGNPGQDAVIVA